MAPIETDPSYADLYRQYLQDNQVSLPGESAINQALNNTQWDSPETPTDYCSIAVVALVTAENAEDTNLRSLYANIALEALQSSQDLLGIAHRSLAAGLRKEPNAIRQALSALLAVSAADADGTAPGLVYLPPTCPPALRGDLLRQVLQADNAQQQALMLTVEVLRRSPLAFYSAQGLRFLQLAVSHYPNVAHLQLQLGLANLFGGRVEGLANLHRARSLMAQDSIQSASLYQALQLAYRPLSAPQAAHWQAQAKNMADGSPAWRWTSLPPESPITYIPFDGLTVAVEASLRSIVTSVLLAEGTWFEAELALWQQQLQPGMVVIDVGANVGVYTFSAAVAVGQTGRVLAIEPFEGCVQCLEETCRINTLDWVTVCGAAASDRAGTAQLALHGSSELNELVTESSSDQGVTVPCITLDGLVDEYGLERVDWIKIDAEGHELPVLKGATSLLQRFKPRILYENVAAGQGANLDVSRWLQQTGYQLYRYHAYLQELEPVEDLAKTRGVLNLIAMPRSDI